MKSILSLFAFCLFAAGFAHAQEGGTSTFPQPDGPVTGMNLQKPHFGLMAGAVDPEGSMKATANAAIDVGYQPYIPFGVGLNLANMTSTNGEGENLTQTTLLGRGTYNFGGTIPVIRDSYVGLGVGPAFMGDGTKLASAPIVGFDIALTQAERGNLSLGANVSYLITEGSSPDAGIVNGVVKYWF